MTIIKPTVGRVVWYWPTSADREDRRSISGQPFAAQICGVHSDTCVNLGITDAEGRYFTRASIPLKQTPRGIGEDGCATWMPYQLGRAAKTEQAEAESCECRTSTAIPQPEDAPEAPEIQIGGDAVSNDFNLPEISTAVFFTGSNITVNIQQ